MSSGLRRVSNNEKEFILTALGADQRVDGRGLFEARRLTTTFAKQDGVVEVQQGSTRVMAVVTGQLGAPYPDRATEGSLAIFTEFSQMADPSFEGGRPGEMAVELGRIIDRGLRESKAVDTECLCVVAGRAVWAIRVDITILDNDGNLVDVANIAALAALLSYRRPDCTVGGSDGHQVIVHPPEVREPLSLIIHHLPIAVTFAFFGRGDIQVVDPSLKEEAVMGGRLTVTVNSQGEICAIQKGGGVGVSAAEIMRCVRIASSKAADLTTQLKKAVEANDIERITRKIKRHPVSASMAVTASGPQDVPMEEIAASSSIDVDRREAVMKMMKVDEMEESSSSGSGSEKDEDDMKDEKKQKVEAGAGLRRVSIRNGVSSADPLPSQRGLFEGSSSFWEDAPSAPTKLFDSDASVELDNVAEGNTMSVFRSCTATSDGFHSVSAAAVYAQMPEHSVGVPRPLGPIFPSSGVDRGSEPEQLSLSPLRVLSGVELKTPTSLLDAVKRKRKKGKNP